MCTSLIFFFFFKQKTAYEMRISYWSSDVCSPDLIESAPDPKKREQELEEELRVYGSPFRTAEAFGVEDIIDPRETRPYLCRFVEAAQARLKTDIGVKLKAGVRP